jgi:6-phosphogluconolactonase
VGEDPCYISLSPDGENLFVANYSTGSLSALAVQADGSLAGPVETLTHVGHGPNPERQTSTHVHMVLPAPDHDFLFATDLGEDRVYVYRFEPHNQAFPLHPAEPSFTTVTAGAGPRHLAFGHDGRFVYLIEEMGEAIVVFKRDGASCSKPYTSGRMKIADSKPIRGKIATKRVAAAWPMAVNRAGNRKIARKDGTLTKM